MGMWTGTKGMLFIELIVMDTLGFLKKNLYLIHKY
jgi:hypothetical protein